MSHSHQSQVPPLAAAYFRSILGAEFVPGYHSPVLIAQVYRPEGPNQGWRRHPIRKRVSGSWLRGLRREGATHVTLRYNDRLADFSIRELLAK